MMWAREEHFQPLVRDEVALRAQMAFAELADVRTLVIVTHSATAMALTNALLGIAQHLHPLAPLANCHWSELATEGNGTPWRLRGHNLGVPGTVLPLPVRVAVGEDAADAEA